jgi:hypothetical protein
MAAGLNVYHDVAGPTAKIGFQATFANHLKLSKGKLAFGIRGGLMSSKVISPMRREPAISSAG